jgi:hypothetical protein
MFYRKRELRRLWEIEVYDGDPHEDPDTPTPTHKETIIAWNAVDAIRSAGGPVAVQPKALFFVTWPVPGDPEENIYRINNTGEGPVGDPIVPSVRRDDPTTDDW